MAYRKSIVGDYNQANETGVNHNRIQINTGAGFTVFAVYLVTVITGSIVFVAVLHWEIFQWTISISIGLCILYGYYCLLQLAKRSRSKTQTIIAIDQYARSRAYLEARVAARAENYVLYEDEEGNLQFRGTTQITENRHFPAQIEAPKEIDATEAILSMFDSGTKSAREIDRWLKYQLRDKPKEQQVSLRQIINKLNTYRPGWQDNSKKVVDAEDYPVEE